MNDFITSSALTRLLANIFIFIVLVGATALVFIAILQHTEVPPVLYTLLGTALGYAYSILSTHSGATIAGPAPTAVESNVPIYQQDTQKVDAVKLP